MRRDKKPMPTWAKRCERKRQEKQITQKELADALNVNYTQMNAVVNGQVNNDNMCKLICDYLGVER